jgi:phosphocarrier protein
MIKTSSEPLVQRIEVVMSRRPGFQLQLAARFAECAQEFRSAIHVRRGRILANGKNVLELLILEAVWRSRLQIEAVGEDAAQAIEAIGDFFQIRKYARLAAAKKLYF